MPLEVMVHAAYSHYLEQQSVDCVCLRSIFFGGSAFLGVFASPVFYSRNESTFWARKLNPCPYGDSGQK